MASDYAYGELKKINTSLNNDIKKQSNRILDLLAENAKLKAELKQFKSYDAGAYIMVPAKDYHSLIKITTKIAAFHK